MKRPNLRVLLSLALPTTLLALACAHHPSDPDLARMRSNPALALEKARRSIGKQCGGSGRPTESCCAALLGEGDALQAAGQREAATEAYERTRSRCPRFHESRRRLYLLRAPGVPVTDPAVKELKALVNLDLDVQLGDDVRLAWYSAYVDGEPVESGHARIYLRPGLHEMTAELYLQPVVPGTLGGPVRFDVVHPIGVPAALAQEKEIVGGALISLRDRGGAGEITDRLSANVDIQDFRRWEPGRPALAAIPHDTSRRVMLAPTVGAGQRIVSDEDAWPDAVKSLDFWALFKICVTTTGTVDQITLMTTTNNDVISDLTAAIQRWRYKPYMITSKVVPFCTVHRVQGPL